METVKELIEEKELPRVFLELRRIGLQFSNISSPNIKTWVYFEIPSIKKLPRNTNYVPLIYFFTSDCSREKNFWSLSTYDNETLPSRKDYSIKHFSLNFQRRINQFLSEQFDRTRTIQGTYYIISTFLFSSFSLSIYLNHLYVSLFTPQLIYDNATPYLFHRLYVIGRDRIAAVSNRRSISEQRARVIRNDATRWKNFRVGFRDFTYDDISIRVISGTATG